MEEGSKGGREKGKQKEEWEGLRGKGRR